MFAGVAPLSRVRGVNGWRAMGRLVAAAVLATAARATAAEDSPPVLNPAVKANGRTAFAQPLPWVRGPERRVFSLGNNFFNTNWVIAPGEPANRDGLGPLFQARSCSACHPFDGRGAPPADGEPLTGLLFRLGTPVADVLPVYGHQLAPRAVPGVVEEGGVKISRRPVRGRFADGDPWELEEPTYAPLAWRQGDPPADLRLSPRVAPAVFGLGLLERIKTEELEAGADADDRDGDGISGRVARLPDGRIGRFGWKAAMPQVADQVAAALVDDMGLTSPLRPEESWTPEQKATLAALPTGGRPEVDAQTFEALVKYMQLLAPPARRSTDAAEVRRGEALFKALRCAACHRPDWTVPEHGKAVRFSPFTDLLLHDMGAGLADDRPEGAATGAEWRTPPLWGQGLLPTVNGHTRLLHDGRARNVEEAILWHGGEAKPARDGFTALPAADRAALRAFLHSL